MRLSWIIGWALNPMTSVFIRRGKDTEKENTQRRRSCEEKALE